MNYSIGMDIGTTTVKCELFRQDPGRSGHPQRLDAGCAGMDTAV